MAPKQVDLTSPDRFVVTWPLVLLALSSGCAALPTAPHRRLHFSNTCTGSPACQAAVMANGDEAADRATCAAASASCVFAGANSGEIDDTCTVEQMTLLCGKARHASRGNCVSCIQAKPDLSACTDPNADEFCAKTDPCDGVSCGDVPGAGTCRFGGYGQMYECVCHDGYSLGLDGTCDGGDDNPDSEFVPCCASCGTYCMADTTQPSSCVATNPTSLFDRERCANIVDHAVVDNRGRPSWGQNAAIDQTTCENVLGMDHSQFTCTEDEHQNGDKLPSCILCDQCTQDITSEGCDTLPRDSRNPTNPMGICPTFTDQACMYLPPDEDNCLPAGTAVADEHNCIMECAGRIQPDRVWDANPTIGVGYCATGCKYTKESVACDCERFSDRWVACRRCTRAGEDRNGLPVRHGICMQPWSYAQPRPCARRRCNQPGGNLPPHLNTRKPKQASGMPEGAVR